MVRVRTLKRSLADFHDISDPPHRVNEPFGETVVDLLPQATDGHVHHVRLAVEMDVPDLRDQFPAGDEAPGVLGQQTQQAKFLGGPARWDARPAGPPHCPTQ
jgi:hypothetical protein